MYQLSRTVNVGGVLLGGGEPVRIQSMNNTNTADAKATLDQIYKLKDCGCDITRVAIPNMDAAEALKEITANSPIPVVADIHFDYRLAIAAAENGAAKIRINPGNIGGPDNVRKVVDVCKERNIPIRVGVNSGSCERELVDKYGGVCAQALCESALGAVRLLEDCNFSDIVVSIKSSSPKLTIETYRTLASTCDYARHVGVTEAGTLKEGVIKSAVGIGALLAEGIGDTIRVSLTDDPTEEVYAAISILKALGLKTGGIDFVSCPTCGRTQVPLIEIANKVEEKISRLPYNLKVAVMGCPVNGPGEAKEADIGLAGSIGEFLMFKKGKICGKIVAKDIDAAVQEFVDEVIRVGEEASKIT